jgi:anti-sigma B factor antagonist
MPDALIFPDPLGGRASFLPPPFACSWSNGSLDSANVHITGELDIATSPQLQETLLEPQLQAQLVVLDLRELAFMDSSGVHAIVNASIRARQVGRRLVLLRGGLDVDRVFTLTGSAKDVEIVDLNPILRVAEEHP